MSNIPEGATHESEGWYYKFKDGIWSEWRKLPETHSHWTDILPTGKTLKNLTPLQPTQWLPEVGQECEYSINGGNYYVCKVICYGSKAAFLKSHKADENGLKEYSVPLQACEFRAIKTEREKFVEDNKHDMYLYAINESKLISMPQSTGEDLAKIVLGYIYDKGARFNG